MFGNRLGWWFWEMLVMEDEIKKKEFENEYLYKDEKISEKGKKRMRKHAK
jgi:hypothetical protein